MNAKLAEIGAELRQAREAQKLSLDDLSRTTLVHSRHLVAIEEGRDEDLPEPFYVKHFIRKYASTVGLPADELANRFWNTQPLAAPPGPLSKGPDLTISWWVFPVVIGALMLGGVATIAISHLRHHKDQVAVSSPAPEGGQHPAKPAAQTAPAHKPAATESVAVASASKAPFAAARASSSKAVLAAKAATSSASPAGNKAPSATKPSPSALAALVNSAPSPAPVVLPGKQISFVARTTDASWMDIVVDGREVQSDVVPAGKTRKWTAMRSLVVRIGNPGAVYGSVNDRSIGALGTKASSVFVRTFLTAEGAKEAKAHPQQVSAGHAKPAGHASHPASAKSGAKPAKPKIAAKKAAITKKAKVKPGSPDAIATPGAPDEPESSASADWNN